MTLNSTGSCAVGDACCAALVGQSYPKIGGSDEPWYMCWSQNCDAARFDSSCV